jgi:hypothetical protein
MMRRVAVVRDGLPVAEALLGLLTTAGFEAVAVPTATEARAQVDGGAVAVILGFLEGTDLQQRFGPVLAMPSATRRGCVVVLVGPGLATADGVRAFLLSADLVVAPNDTQRLGELLRTALVTKRDLVALLDPAAAARLAG